MRLKRRILTPWLERERVTNGGNKMSRLIACCLLACVIGPAAFGQNIPVGKRLVIRRYHQLDTNREVFDGIIVMIEPTRLAVDPAKLTGRGALVVMAADQTDPAVAEALGKGIYSVRYESGRINGGKIRPEGLVLTDFGIGYPIQLLQFSILDAFGQPMAGATVDAALWRDGPFIGRYQTGAKGELDLPGPCGAFPAYELTISHERYGTFMEQVSQSTGSRVMTAEGSIPLEHPPQRRPVKLVAVAADDPVLDRCLLGRVLLPDGNPAAGALIMTKQVVVSGLGSISHDPHRILSGPDGRFRFYIPENMAFLKFGELVPKGTDYVFSVELPNDPQQPRIDCRMPGGTETDIRLLRGNRPRRFAFEDDNGPITDPKRLAYLQVSYRGVADSPQLWIYDSLEFTQTHNFPPGCYWGFDGLKRLCFGPVVIASNSPDVITLRPVKETSYEGRVFDAITSRPLEGALVVAQAYNLGTNRIEDITHDQWKAIHKLPVKPDLSDPALAPLRKMCMLAGVAITDADGRYQLRINKGDGFNSMFVANENYLALAQRADQATSGIKHLDDAWLFPAATVTLSLDAPVTDTLYFWPKWKIDRVTLPPQWVEIFFPKRPGLDYLFTYSDGLTFSGDRRTRTLQVPAGVTLGLDLNVLGSPWRPIQIAGPIRLAQGEHKDLGTFAHKPAAEVSVQVIGPDGDPIEVVAVSCHYTNSDKQDLTTTMQSTLYNGIARFWIVPGTPGEFSIFLFDQKARAAMPRVPFNCAEEARTLPMHTIKLTAEQLAIVKAEMQPKSN